MSADVGVVTYERRSGGLNKNRGKYRRSAQVSTYCKQASASNKMAAKVSTDKINMDTGVNIELPRKEICDKNQTMMS